MAIDIDQIIKELEHSAPKWFTEGIAQSKEFQQMNIALKALATKTAGPEYTKLQQSIKDTKESLSDFDKTLSKADGSFDDLVSGNESRTGRLDKDEKLRKRHMDTSTQHFGSALKNLVSLRVMPAFNEFGLGMKSLSGAYFGSTVAVEIATAAVYEFAKYIDLNNQAYLSLSKSGFVLSDSLGGISKAALEANMSFEDFAKLADRNAQSLALLYSSSGDGSTVLAEMVNNIKFSSQEMYKFGFSVEEMTDTTSDYLDIQKATGQLNKRSTKELTAGATDLMASISDTSATLGIMRKDVLSLVKESIGNVSWRYYLLSLGDDAKGVSDTFLKVTAQLGSSLTGDFAKQSVEVVQQLEMFGAALGKDQQKFLAFTTQYVPKLGQLFNEEAKRVRNNNAMSSEESAIRINEIFTGIKDSTKKSLSQMAITGDEATKAYANSLLEQIETQKNLHDEAEKYREETVKATGATMTYEQALAHIIDKTNEYREANQETTKTVQMFHEAIQAVENLIQVGFLSVLGISRDGLKSFTESVTNIAAGLTKFNSSVGGLDDAFGHILEKIAATLTSLDFWKDVATYLVEGLVKAALFIVKSAAHIGIGAVKGLFGLSDETEQTASSSLDDAFGSVNKGVNAGFNWMREKPGEAGAGAAPVVGTATVAAASSKQAQSPIANSMKPKAEYLAGGPNNVSQWDQYFIAAGKQYGIRPELLKGIMMQESHGDPNARSPAGALGLMQFMPKTAAGFGFNPMNPVDSINGAAQYIAQLKAKYGGDEGKALAAYNEGAGNLDKGKMPAETRAYVPKVLGYAAKYQSQFSPDASNQAPPVLGVDTTYQPQTTTPATPDAPAQTPAPPAAATPTPAKTEDKKSQTEDPFEKLLGSFVMMLAKLDNIVDNTSDHTAQIKKLTTAVKDAGVTT